MSLYFCMAILVVIIILPQNSITGYHDNIKHLNRK
uniref:Uncharacterized protein n=1 Tax=Anguilla anguilla TaxID=7936 RepID=A0A0E9WCM2_ANGAN